MHPSVKFEMIVRFVDIVGMNHHHCLSFLFIITVTQSNLYSHDNIETKLTHKGIY
jgi:hypothetical protein